MAFLKFDDINYMEESELDNTYSNSITTESYFNTTLVTISKLNKEYRDSITEFYSYINIQIGKVKDFKKAVDKADALKEAKLAYFKNIISVYKQCVSVATVVKSAKIGAFGQRAKQSLVISKKLVALAKKDEPKKEEKTNNESFTYQFESGMNFFTSDLL